MHGKFKARFLASASHLLKGVGASALSLLIGSTLLDHTAQPGVASGAREARPAVPASAPFAGKHAWWEKNSPPPPGDGLKRNMRNGERDNRERSDAATGFNLSLSRRIANEFVAISKEAAML